MARINPSWERAAEIAAEMDNNTESNIRRILSEFKKMRADVQALGFDDDDVVECWRWLRTREDFPIKEARLSTVLKGSPTYLVQWRQQLKEEMPSIGDSAAYDDYVRTHAKTLRKNNFRYRWSNQEAQTDGSRMTYDEAKSLGLVEE